MYMFKKSIASFELQESHEMRIEHELVEHILVWKGCQNLKLYYAEDVDLMMQKQSRF